MLWDRIQNAPLYIDKTYQISNHFCFNKIPDYFFVAVLTVCLNLRLTKSGLKFMP